MSESKCGQVASGTGCSDEFEIVKIRKSKRSCGLCEEFAQTQLEKPIAILSCEGACLRGEISRQVANLICFEMAPEKTVRICLGGAFTKDTGQRNIVRSADRVIALEGCFIECASRMMNGVIPELKPEIIITDALADFDKDLFGMNEISSEDIADQAKKVAVRIVEKL